MISRMKMEGQVSTPVAKQLLENIPEGLTNGELEQARSEIERQELRQLMNLEMHLSPVNKRTTRQGAGPILNQSNLYS